MKNKYKVVILGAGVGGLGTACWTKQYTDDFVVIEAEKSLPLNFHNGVHYLHSIPLLPFEPDVKEITLTDGVLTHDGIIKHEPELIDALNYSEKVREIQHPSSIMEVGKSKKAFLPSNSSLNTLVREMYEYVGRNKFEFGECVSEIGQNYINLGKGKNTQQIEFEFLINTIPLKVFLDLVRPLNIITEGTEFKCTPIFVTNLYVEKIVPNWLINIYVPNSITPVYRASILNGILSVESIQAMEKEEIEQLKHVFFMFHVNSQKKCESYLWKTGKIVSISIDQRREILSQLLNSNIASIGRFGLWNRKLLVDSTIRQAEFVTKRMLCGAFEQNKSDIAKELSQ